MITNLENPPKRKTIDYLQADYIELLCLFNRDRVIGQGDIHNRYLKYADIDNEPQEDEYEDEEQAADDEELGEAELSDRWTERFEGFFRNLEYRATAFGDLYPFEISDSLNQINVKSRLSEHQKLYVYLLMASSLRNFDKGVQTRIGNSFEYISAEALRQYVGEKAEVHIFAANPPGRYTGNIKTKINKLARDLFEESLVRENPLSSHSSKDEGLDIVGWFPFEDETPNRLLIFGQCACGEDWKGKQSSSDYKAWAGHIRLSIEPVNSIFIPYCFRDARGNWYAKHEIRMSLMIDRLRIMNLLREVESPLGELPLEIRSLIEDTLSFVEEF